LPASQDAGRRPENAYWHLCSFMQVDALIIEVTSFVARMMQQRAPDLVGNEGNDPASDAESVSRRFGCNLNSSADSK
jgi:hypothetical protein